MSTYLINHLRIPGGVPTEESLRYLELVQATTEAYGARWLAVDAAVQVIEGAWPGSVVLIEFPDAETAKAWYNSPEYQEILSLRTAHTINDLILVDSVGPEFTVAGYAQQIRTLLGQ
ncbi:DUF1330 domain-containing protein [Micromonospora sp. WMMD964]|uniref:DUF1330 domain-containing protein n=1 Tax=Micromonospora sp. WMMD964 TaxID=3016091 RepID=UPI00249B93AA|nr:DUF1330 domain-containing protein [Micromonospora sp. WMMD964]WFE98915.1 DUF1330 domain-containing protein [Micromonospora sp. WMMD964]